MHSQNKMHFSHNLNDIINKESDSTFTKWQEYFYFGVNVNKHCICMYVCLFFSLHFWRVTHRTHKLELLYTLGKG